MVLFLNYKTYIITDEKTKKLWNMLLVWLVKNRKSLGLKTASFITT